MFDALFPSHWSDIQKLMWLKILNGGSAVWDTISGNPVTFSAKAAPLRQLKVAFSPVQDLHGYDSPWPAGGGKNKFDNATAPIYGRYIQYVSESVARWRESGDSASYCIPVAPNTTYAIKTHSDTTIFRVAAISTDPATMGSADVESSNFYAGSSATNKYCTITTGASENWLVIQLGKSFTESRTGNIMVELGTQYSDFAPYSNICPISGWDKVELNQAGKNLLAKPIEQINNVTDEVSSCFFLKAGTYTASFGTIDNATSWRFALKMKDKDGNNLSDESHKPSPYVTWNATSKVWLGGSNITSKVYSFTLVEDCYIRCVLAIGDTSTSTVVHDGQLDQGSTKTDFASYIGRDIIIQLGDTYYGAQLDVLTGQAKITHEKVILTGTESYYTYTSGGVNSFRTSSNPFVNSDDVMCNMMPPTGSYTSTGICISQNNHIVYFVDAPNFFGIGTTVADWKAKLASLYADGTPLEYIAELATPIPISLTPQEIQSLLGVNNMWSNANGDLTVEYRSN